MKKYFAFLASLLIVIPFVRADVYMPLVSQYAGIQALTTIFVGVLEGFIIWLVVRKDSLWKWLWIPATIIVNIITGIIGIPVSIATDLVLTKYHIDPRIYRGDFAYPGIFFAYLFSSFLLTVALEWLLLRLVQKRHDVPSGLLLVALGIANALSYACLVLLVL